MRVDGESGITLVEALVALAILALAVTAVLETSGRTLRTQAMAEAHVEGVALAEWKMNELATLSADSLARRSALEFGEVALDARRYRWETTIVPDPDSRDLWHASVSVEWNGGRYDLATVFFRRAQHWALRGTP